LLHSEATGIVDGAISPPHHMAIERTKVNLDVSASDMIGHEIVIPTPEVDGVRA